MEPQLDEHEQKNQNWLDKHLTVDNILYLINFVSMAVVICLIGCNNNDKTITREKELQDFADSIIFNIENNPDTIKGTESCKNGTCETGLIILAL